MIKIIKYKATDGKEFDNESDCLEYENLIEEIENIMSILVIPPKKGVDFSNGCGFIQQDGEQVKEVKIKLLEIFKRYSDHQWIKQTIDNDNASLSFVGRLIDDMNIRPLNSAWYRLMCIDNKFREWGQAYFALNPDKGKQIKLNKEQC